MTKLGQKIQKRTRRLGRKFDEKVHKLGQKTNDVMSKIDNKVHKLGKQTHNFLDDVENINNKIIKKSGKAINIGGRVIGTADKIVGVLNDAGVKNVPLLGTATSAVEVGLHNSKKGLDKANKYRDKYIEHSKKAIKKGHRVGNALEKQNTRKYIEKKINELNDDEGDFV